MNPSDALGALGYFSHTHLPRIPGRDFAGVVIKGSPDVIGKKVWGTGGAVGIDRNGGHAEHLTLPESSLSEIPNNLSPEEAGAQTLPYTTAYYSLVSRAQIKPNEEVLVIGSINTIDFNFEENKAFLADLKEGFEWKKLTPLPISKETTFSLSKATEA
ncbi:zinc-binding alcohol dehydrogenase family protein [Candidatus Neptunichlamydia sp. REUL1]|uniref:zinc-binding alcohol dehydrogenase family protein n=1 Tax=Candidatus Neptunichlamydia sp. REUL1 TaxID=3064277 RepID=UPI00292D334E|nr:zinc-binding alcohol dehydrogenase family protein [Candidatus Neptunochlamydia sp. REUL1]